ncbi:MAG: AAA family ATPase [Pirellulaceae bacterium]|nr:AAA family ATPase [Pirellulaceae bacterium]
MLTRLTIRNFKRFDLAEIELGNPVIFVGPNNSGKTTALQALALWDIGVKRWNEKRRGKKAPEKRPGVTINRRDLISLPVPESNLLWRDLHVRDVKRVDGEQKTQNIRIDIIVDGVTAGKEWTCGLEFDYANEESFYCRPLRRNDEKDAGRLAVPDEASDVSIAFLPPMSGLAANETKLDPGAINVRLGEGRTAEVLRNLCYAIYSHTGGEPSWIEIRDMIRTLFGCQLNAPEYISERGEITMSYTDQRNKQLDLSSAGRGFQQTLLLLAHLFNNPGSVVLIDEPDAHLEILRQRQIYEVMTKVATSHHSQIIAASHSEVVLNEAADRDVVVAFLGKPHRIDDRGGGLLKSLKEIGFDQFYQAEQTGWVLYLEGSTDLSILQAFARLLEHAAREVLERPFVHYVSNQPNAARRHFHGLREAKPDLVGVAIFDHLDRPLQEQPGLGEFMWSRREIENYLCSREVLLTWAVTLGEKADKNHPDLFGKSQEETMEQTISEIEAALHTLGKPSPWSPTIKATDEFLDKLFDNFFRKLSLPNLMRKADYHRLADFIEPAQIDPEVTEMLDRIVETASQAVPLAAE